MIQKQGHIDKKREHGRFFRSLWNFKKSIATYLDFTEISKDEPKKIKGDKSRKRKRLRQYDGRETLLC